MADRPVSATSDTLDVAIHTPLPLGDEDLFDPPRASYLESEAQTPRDSYTPPFPPSASNSGPLLPDYSKPELDENSGESPAPPSRKRRPLLLLLAGLVALAVLVLAVVLPVYFTVIKPKQRNVDGGIPEPSSTTTPAGDGPIGDGKPGKATSGGDGSTVETDDGSTFTYTNKFGGYSYPGSIDEWTLSTMMRADTANGGINQLENHYDTFITEQDIAQIAGAGLNWVRVPVPFWAIETWSGEPFLAQTSWKYILRLLKWCRKYGIRVNLDLHTIPGSQNGYNHSGKYGQVNFLNGVMGVANAQRALEYIRVFTEFISQPEYKDVVPVFSIMNEALLSTIGRSQLTSFYLQAHTMIRNITGYGAGNGPFIGIHDGFAGISTWADFLPGSDRILLDTHPYFAFDNSPATSPIDTGTGMNAGGVWPAQACNRWAAGINNRCVPQRTRGPIDLTHGSMVFFSLATFGVTVAGEFSNGFNDCGLFLRGVPGSSTYGGNCNDWQDSSNWTAGTKAGLMQFAMASMDALGDFFFWTWKIGNSTAGIVESPLWSYQLGLQNGWMPTDPRTSIGTCAALGVSGPIFDGTFLPWQTGGVGAGTIAPSATMQYPWPPATISNVDGAASLLPTYTPTASIVSLPPPTLSPTPTKKVDVGSGWFNSQDTALAPTPIAGCTYPDPWNAINAAVPPLC
ncbi:hypothetical protein H0H81_002192 [Sphagnurus paluster]|uniref:glucan 1,3-beta-glucosidase n=1 Tax=Sphagnurus paluster TaxID=117069 RepID=A0A9P7GTE7_9AGAR|nr:hypothetical protein H0H81_002192 [Sphagnurus paluster]